MTNMIIKNPINKDKTDYILLPETEYGLLFYSHKKPFKLLISLENKHLLHEINNWKENLPMKYDFEEACSYTIIKLEKLFAVSRIYEINQISSEKKYLIVDKSRFTLENKDNYIKSGEELYELIKDTTNFIERHWVIGDSKTAVHRISISRKFSKPLQKKRKKIGYGY